MRANPLLRSPLTGYTEVPGNLPGGWRLFSLCMRIRPDGERFFGRGQQEGHGRTREKREHWWQISSLHFFLVSGWKSCLS